MAASTPKIYTVGEINTYLEKVLAQDPFLRRLTVRGEVTNCRYRATGHLYFNIKDAEGLLSVVMFASDRGGLFGPIQDGDEVLVTGRVGVYKYRGVYQLYASRVEAAGRGELMAQMERKKKELEAEGLFDAMYKKPLPRFVRTLGVVTAETGAALRDIIRISKSRNPGIRILLSPAIVQGDQAPASLIAALSRLDAAGCDVIILGRGGGSFEDLNCFNDEGLARAVFACRTPVVSAVGHQTDTVITDFVADLSVATPSHAAEAVVFSRDQVSEELAALQNSMTHHLQIRLRLTGHRLRQCARISDVMHGEINQTKASLKRDLESLHTSMTHRCQLEHVRLTQQQHRLSASDPARQLQAQRNRLGELKKRLPLCFVRRRSEICGRLSLQRQQLAQGMDRCIERRAIRMSSLAQGLDAASPARKLASGYAFLRKADGKRIVSIGDIEPKEVFFAELTDGTLEADVRAVRRRPALDAAKGVFGSG